MGICRNSANTHLQSMTIAERQPTTRIALHSLSGALFCLLGKTVKILLNSTKYSAPRRSLDINWFFRLLAGHLSPGMALTDMEGVCYPLTRTGSKFIQPGEMEARE